MQTFENRIQSANILKQYHYCLCVNYKNGESGDVMQMHVTCSVCRYVHKLGMGDILLFAITVKILPTIRISLPVIITIV